MSEEIKVPKVSQWKGIWKDNKGRFVEIEHWETPEGLSKGFVLGVEITSAAREHYRDGNNVVDGSKLMIRKIGAEAGWPK